MKCTNCGHSNRAGARFCSECGASLAAAVSNSVCPSCGFTNRRGVKFCEECGADLTAADTIPLPVQPAPPPRAGMPGWAWALIGCGAVALMVLAAILLWQKMPLRAVAPIETVPAEQPAVLVTVTAGQHAAASSSYCPQAGAVILYWNAGYNCDNGRGDDGYRVFSGQGWRDVKNDYFDNQASSVVVPEGWSVRLYEGAGRTGETVCFNTSVADFAAKGNFPKKSISINDNVSSMQVFADRQCGKELAAGAAPARRPAGAPTGCQLKGFTIDEVFRMEWNERERLGIDACDCLPEELRGINEEMELQEFKDKYIQDSYIEDDRFVVVLNEDFARVSSQIIDNIAISFSQMYKDEINGDVFYIPCSRDGDGVKCISKQVPGLADKISGDVYLPSFDITNLNHDTINICTWLRKDEGQDSGLFNLAPPGGQCTVSGYSVVCGSICCRDNKKCCFMGGVFQCVRSSCNCNPKSSACSY